MSNIYKYGQKNYKSTGAWEEQSKFHMRNFEITLGV